MNFLVSLLKIVTYLQWIAMGTIIAVGAGIVLRGLQLRNRVLAGLGLAVGLSPVLVPMALNRSSESGREEAIVTITELKALIAEFLYLYHISHHSGIDAAPLDKWQRSALVHGRDMILDERKFDIVTGVEPKQADMVPEWAQAMSSMRRIWDDTPAGAQVTKRMLDAIAELQARVD